MINFSDRENVNELIELEKISLTSTLEIQKNLNKQILMFIKRIMADVTFDSEINPEDESFFYLNESTNALNKSNSNITILNNLIDYLDKIKQSEKQHLDSNIKEYNARFTENINEVYSNTEIIERFVYQITTTDFSKIFKKQNEIEGMNAEEAVQDEEIKQIDVIENTELNSRFIENTLVISEIQQRVILPYNINTVKDILLNNPDGYNSLQGVINKVYTKSIDYYKFTPIARFKEAYKLVREKEKGSRTKALGLAFELFWNYNLHPAIITACNSLDELDIYLACLEDNTLEDFKYFDVKYEIPPAVPKHNRNFILEKSLK